MSKYTYYIRIRSESSAVFVNEQRSNKVEQTKTIYYTLVKYILSNPTSLSFLGVYHDGCMIIILGISGELKQSIT